MKIDADLVIQLKINVAKSTNKKIGIDFMQCFHFYRYQ